MPRYWLPALICWQTIYATCYLVLVRNEIFHSHGGVKVLIQVVNSIMLTPSFNKWSFAHTFLGCILVLMAQNIPEGFFSLFLKRGSFRLCVCWVLTMAMYVVQPRFEFGHINPVRVPPRLPVSSSRWSCWCSSHLSLLLSLFLSLHLSLLMMYHCTLCLLSSLVCSRFFFLPHLHYQSNFL